MDEELKKLLDDARSKGASKEQLQNIVDLYSKKKNEIPNDTDSTLENGTSESSTQPTVGTLELQGKSNLNITPQVQIAPEPKPTLKEKYSASNRANFSDEEYKQAQNEGYAPPNSELIAKSRFNINLNDLSLPPEEQRKRFEEISQPISESLNKTQEAIQRQESIKEGTADIDTIYNLNPDKREDFKKSVSTIKKAKDLDIEYPFRYYSDLDKNESNEFIENKFGSEKLQNIGIDLADFDGFLTKKGYKKDYLDREERGLFSGGDETGFGGENQALSDEMERYRMLLQYIGEQNKRANLKTKYDKNESLGYESNDESIPITKFNTTALREYIDEQFPIMTRVLKERDEKNKELYQKHINDEAGFWYGAGQFFNKGWQGIEDRVNKVSATVYDSVGLDNVADNIRYALDQTLLARPNTREIVYASGQEVEDQGRTYIVDSNNRIIDKELKIDVTDLFLDPKPIYEKAKSSNSSSVFSPQGAIMQTGNVVGDMMVQLLAQASLNRAGLGSTSSAIIAQSALGYSSGLEDAYRDAKEAGINDEEAKDIANDVAGQMAIWYGATSIISPQTKATEALFGSEKKAIINGAINAYKESGKSGVQNYIKNFTSNVLSKETAGKLAEKGVTFLEEGSKEALQENIQQTGELYINDYFNERVKSDNRNTEMSLDDFINTTILSFTAGGLTPMANIGGNKYNNVDKLTALKLLADSNQDINSIVNPLIEKGVLSNDQATELTSDFNAYKKHRNSIPQNLDPDIALSTMQDLEKIEQLENKKKNLDISFHDNVNTEIEGIREGIKTRMNTETEETAPETESSVTPEAQNFAEQLGTTEDISQYVEGATKVRVGNTDVVLKSEGDNIKIESIATPDKTQRGQGSARKAIEEVTTIADEQGKTLELNVVPLDSDTNAERLASFYESVGFVKDENFDEGDGGRMVRQPQANQDTFAGIDSVLNEVDNTQSQTLRNIEENKKKEIISNWLNDPLRKEGRRSEGVSNVEADTRKPVIRWTNTSIGDLEYKLETKEERQLWIQWKESLKNNDFKTKREIEQKIAESVSNRILQEENNVPIQETQEISTNQNDYTVQVKDGQIDIKPKLGNKKPSASEVKKVTDSYIENTNFDTGTNVDLSNRQGATAEQVSDIVANESTNPTEVAQEIQKVKQRTSEDLTARETTKEGAIAQALQGVQVNKESFAMTDDRNNISSVNPYYFSSRNKNLKGNEGNIDRIREVAQQYTNEEVSMQDIADFMKQYRNPSEYTEATPESNTLTDLETKFQELTGLKPTNDLINKIVGEDQNIQQQEDTTTDDGVPFQTESRQTRISGRELSGLVNRLKKTGLAKAVNIFSSKQISDFLNKLGINNVQLQAYFEFKNIAKEKLTPDSINSIRTSLRRSNPDSLTLQILDAVANENIDAVEDYELQQLVEYGIDEGLSFGNVSAMMVEDGIVEDRQKGISKIMNIGETGRNIKNYQSSIKFQNELSKKGVTITPNGFVYNGEVYLNRDEVKADTPIHEFSHLWNEYAKQQFPLQYQRGLDLIENTEYHKAVQENPAYKHLDNEGQLEEALAQAIGEKGVKILNESKKENFATWFKNLFSRIAKGLGLTSITGDQLANLTLEKYTDLVAGELLAGREIVPNKTKEVKTKVNEADVNNIDIIVSVQEALQELKSKLREETKSKGKFVDDVKKELVKHINSVINSKRINEIQKSELSKLLTNVKNAKTKRGLLKSIDVVNNIATGLDNKILIKGINKILKSNTSRKESGRRKANITTEEAEKIIKGVKANVEVPIDKDNKKPKTERIQDRIDELINRRDAIESKTNQTEEELIELDVINASLDYLLATSTKDVDFANKLLNRTNDFLKEVYENGRNELKALREARKESDEKFVSDINEDINPEGVTSLKTTNELDNENKQLKNIIKRAVFTIFDGKLIGSLDSLASLISKKGGENRDSSPLVQFVNNLKSRETLKKTRINNFSKKVVDAQKDIFGSITKANKELNKKHTITLERYPDNDTSKPKEPIDLEFTNSQLLNVWMNSQNEDLLSGLEANGFDEDIIDKIDNMLPESVKEYGEFLFGVYEDMYVDSNEVYEKMNFHSLGKSKNYAGKVYRDNISFEEDTNALLGGITNINTTGYGSQKERTINNNPIQAVDANFLVQKAIQESSHYVAFAESHRLYNKMLRDNKIQKSIQLTNKGNGDQIISLLNYYKVRDLEQGGSRSVNWLDFFGRNIAKSTLALKAKIGLTQTVSILNGSFDMPTGLSPAKFLSYYNPKTWYETAKYLKENSDYIKNRYGVGGIDEAVLGLKDISSQSEFAFSGSNLEAQRKAVSRTYKNLLDKAMLNVKIGDRIGVMGAVPAYNAWYDRFKSQGDSETVAREKAMEKFEASVDRSQQTTSAFGKSQFQKHPVARYFTMFATAPIQNQQNAMYHFRELMRGLKKGQNNAKGTNVRNALAFMNYQFAQPMLYTYIAQLMAGSIGSALGFGDDEPDDSDKDLLRSAIMGNSNSIPIFGGIAQLLIEKSLGKEYSYGSLVSSALLDSTTKLQEQWINAFSAKTEKSRQNNLDKALRGTAGLLLAFPNFIYDNTDLDYKVLDDIYYDDEIDAEVKFLKAFGYSDYIIEQARKERVSKAKSQREKDNINRKYENSKKKYENYKTNPIFKRQEGESKRK